jgi:hypothetical protein
MGFDGYSTVLDHEAVRTAGQSAVRLKRQRSVDEPLLRRVAQIYEAAPEKPTKAVAVELLTSHRSAARYVNLARKRGFLPEWPAASQDTEED